MQEDCLIHWSEEPLLKIYSVNQPMTHRKPYGFVGDGPDGWRAWCDGPDGRRLDELSARRLARKFRYRTEIPLAPNAQMLIISTAAEVDDVTARYGRDGSRLIDWPAIAKLYHGIIAAPWVVARGARWYRTWDCSCGCIWDARAVAELRCNRAAGRPTGSRAERIAELLFRATIF
jgi:hypothetical protein